MASRDFNILYLSTFGTFWGGGQISLFHLVKNLDKLAFRPYVGLPEEGVFAEKLREQNVDVSILELPKVADFRIHKSLNALNNIMKLTRKYNIDLIHTDGPRNTFYAGLAAKIRKLPVVWHIRASSPDKYDRLLVHLCSKLILVANSLSSRFNWMSRSGKLVTIYNGIDLSEFRKGKESSRIREEYGIPNQSLLIGSIGRLEYLKGQKYLIEACGMLKDKLMDFRLLLAGEVVDSAYFMECKDMARSLGIEDCVIFPGYLSNVSEILNEIDIFVLASLAEAFPRSLIEAMGAGKPVVITDVGGCPEAVEDGISGFTVKAKNSTALADRIIRLARKPEMRKEIGEAARTRAEAMFSIEQNIRATERVYKDLLEVQRYDIP
ncbi:MAG: glycosyltransferase family 4 protein [Deltaproteobacteria bacterium]|nr:glycosyltransferase family 4 protein [Deltaproteobacteria bacterium]